MVDEEAEKARRKAGVAVVVLVVARRIGRESADCMVDGTVI